MNKYDINKRIKELIELLGLSGNQFAKSVNTSSSRISNITTERNAPDSVLLQRILTVYTNVRSEWLLIGDGNPFKESQDRKGNENLDINNGYSNTINNNDLIRMIREMSEEIGKLKEQNRNLTEDKS